MSNKKTWDKVVYEVKKIEQKLRNKKQRYTGTGGTQTIETEDSWGVIMVKETGWLECEVTKDPQK
tara:strand:- start:624 stop:818 length:195 start_codon:yes stop_codon:yes gene_type:complete